MAGQSVSMPHDAGVVGARPVDQMRMRHQHGRVGIRQHEGEALGRIIRVEWQVGAASPEDAEEPDDHLGRALHAQGDDDFGPDAETTQMVRQLIGAGVKLRVGEPLVPEHDGGRAGRTCRLRAEQLRQGRGRDRTRGVVPPPQEGGALPGAQDIQPPDRLLRPRHRRRQQPHQTIAQRLDAAPLEQVGGVFDDTADAPRRAVLRTLLAENKRQVEPAAGYYIGLKPRAQRRQFESDLRIVVERQHHLE